MVAILVPVIILIVIGISLLFCKFSALKRFLPCNRKANAIDAINKQKSQLDHEAYEKYHALLRESIRAAEEDYRKRQEQIRKSPSHNKKEADPWSET